jgi:cytidine deaminase
MNNLLDKMFIKRFCLPIDSDITLYENGNKNINSCLCGHYNHVSCVLKVKGIFEKNARILSYGINIMGDSEGLQPGIHAEHDAIRKLLPLRRNKRLENINILVIRLSGKNQLQSSKPCFNCIEMMKTLPITLGYKIKNVYYSNTDRKIVKTTLRNLENEEIHYSRYYRKNDNKI